MGNTYLHFLNDSIKELISRALDIENDTDFDKGTRLGFYEAISHLLNQAEGFGIFDELDNEIKEFNLESLI